MNEKAKSILDSMSEADIVEFMLAIEEHATRLGYRTFAMPGDVTDKLSVNQTLLDFKANENEVIKPDGSVPLEDNWVTPYKITAEQIASSTPIGTSPFEVVSTTCVTNLNADSVDGVHASALEPTVSKGNLTAGSTKITIGGTGTGAVIGAGVSVDVAQANLDHGSIGGLADDDHTQYIKHSLATAVSDFLVGAGTSTFTFVKKTLDEVKTILGLGSAAYTASTDYAVSAKGVTNGDSHDHIGGDGGQIDHGGLGGLTDDDHTQYLRADATRALSADWDAGNGRMIQTDKIRARDGDGLALYEDGGAGLFVKDGGNVGIGTSAPNAPFEIATTSGVPVIVRNTVANGYALLDFRNDQNSALRSLSFGYMGSTYPDSANIGGIVGEIGLLRTTGNYPLEFATNLTTRMVILGNGLVGIGTTAPTSKLHVVGLPVYTTNALAVAGGLTAGSFYRTNGDPDLVCVVH